MTLRTTQEAARELGIGYAQLFNLIRYGRIVPPQKTGSGEYYWTDDDLTAARNALSFRKRRVERREMADASA